MADRFGKLRDQIRGRVIAPADEDYEQERALYNAMIETRPAAIAKVTGPDDIAAAIRFAREADIPIAVRAGGHSVAGHSLVQDGLVIDVRPLKSIEVDPKALTVRAGSGVTMGEFDAANQAHGLATTGGRVTTTGLAGYTLGGGNGWTDRTFGLAIDNLLSVELVTAEGTQVTASAEENPELFWAVRGGGGNFGVATSFTLRLHPLGTAYAGLLLYDVSKAPDVVPTYRDLMDGSPREAGGGLVYLNAPEEEEIPEHLRGRLAVGVVYVWAGDPAGGERHLEPLRALKPDLDAVGPVPYAEFNGSLDDPPGLRNYWTAEYLETLADDALRVYMEHSERMPARTASQSAMIPWGGAVQDIDDEDTPLTSRHANWHLHPFCLWEEPGRDDEVMSWGRGIRDAMKPFATGGVYLNFIGDEGQDRIIAAYGRPKYDRLAKIKAEWDPDNLFHGNQNIKPAR